jgi:hypothetical protein
LAEVEAVGLGARLAVAKRACLRRLASVSRGAGCLELLDDEPPVEVRPPRARRRAAQGSAGSSAGPPGESGRGEPGRSSRASKVICSQRTSSPTPILIGVSSSSVFPINAAITALELSGSTPRGRIPRYAIYVEHGMRSGAMRVLAADLPVAGSGSPSGAAGADHVQRGSEEDLHVHPQGPIRPVQIVDLHHLLQGDAC